VLLEVDVPYNMLSRLPPLAGVGSRRRKCKKRRQPGERGARSFAGMQTAVSTSTQCASGLQGVSCAQGIFSSSAAGHQEGKGGGPCCTNGAQEQPCPRMIIVISDGKLRNIAISRHATAIKTSRLCSTCSACA
jgi:hypothetical protein